jgi:hypothetical protein
MIIFIMIIEAIITYFLRLRMSTTEGTRTNFCIAFVELRN